MIRGPWTSHNRKYMTLNFSIQFMKYHSTNLGIVDLAMLILFHDNWDYGLFLEIWCRPSDYHQVDVCFFGFFFSILGHCSINWVCGNSKRDLGVDMIIVSGLKYNPGMPLENGVGLARSRINMRTINNWKINWIKENRSFLSGKTYQSHM